MWHEGDDDIADPAPVTRPRSRKGVKRRLPLRADVEVDRKKYKGERVSRDDAEIADVIDVAPLDGPAAVEDTTSAPVSTDEDEFGIVNDVREPSEHDNDLDDDSALDPESDESEGDGEIREQEKALNERLNEEKSREARQAHAVSKQKKAHDSVIESRIRLEQVLSVARGFPHTDDRNSPEWERASEDVEEVAQSLEQLAAGFSEAVMECSPSAVDLELKSSYAHWRDGVLDKWSRRVREAEGSAPRGGFKVLDVSLSGALRASLATGRHDASSRRVRTALPLHGDSGTLEEGESDLQYDDRDLYHSLLREVIEGEGALRHAQVARTGRVRRTIDRKATKGRRLRYVVHEKLVGFLTPVPLPEPGPVDEILAGLFGKRKLSTKATVSLLKSA